MLLRKLVRQARLLRTPMHDRHFVVLKNHRLIYARIPKAANTSIKRALKAHVGLKPKVAGAPVNTDRFWFHRPEYGTDVVSAREVLARYPDFFTFTFVRNPFDRLVSCYNHKIVRNERLGKGLAPLGFSQGMSFADFVVRVSVIEDARADRHFRGQVDMLSYEGRYVPQFTGRVENAGDWDRLAETLRARDGFEIGPLEQSHVRRADRSDLLEFFADPALVRLVQERYKADFEKFYPDAADIASTMKLLTGGG